MAKLLCDREERDSEMWWGTTWCRSSSTSDISLQCEASCCAQPSCWCCTRQPAASQLACCHCEQAATHGHTMLCFHSHCSRHHNSRQWHCWALLCACQPLPVQRPACREEPGSTYALLPCNVTMLLLCVCTFLQRHYATWPRQARTGSPWHRDNPCWHVWLSRLVCGWGHLHFPLLVSCAA